MPKRRKLTNPRVTIYENRRATLSGITYDDLRSLMTQAALHNYQALDKAKADGDEDGEAHARESLLLADRVDAAIVQAIRASHHPSPSQRTGWRHPEERRPSKAERRRAVEQKRIDREVNDRMIEDLVAERQRLSGEAR